MLIAVVLVRGHVYVPIWSSKAIFVMTDLSHCRGQIILPDGPGRRSTEIASGTKKGHSHGGAPQEKAGCTFYIKSESLYSVEPAPGKFGCKIGHLVEFKVVIN